MSIFETFLCANFQKFETFIRALEVRQRAIEQVLQRARHVRGQRQRLDAHQELVGTALDRDGARRVPRQLAHGSVSTRTRSSSARRSTGTARLPFLASWRAASSAATSRMPSCTMAPSCASCPNGPWCCSTRQSVRGFARCRKASGLCRAASSASARLQNAHQGSCRSRPSSVSVVLLASKAAWQLARVKSIASLASASRHTLPRRARGPCRCRVCAATQGTPKTFVVKEAERSLGDGGGRGVIFFEGANKLVHAGSWNMHVGICNMHVETQHLFLMPRLSPQPFAIPNQANLGR